MAHGIFGLCQAWWHKCPVCWRPIGLLSTSVFLFVNSLVGLTDIHIHHPSERETRCDDVDILCISVIFIETSGGHTYPRESPDRQAYSKKNASMYTTRVGDCWTTRSLKTGSHGCLTLQHPDISRLVPQKNISQSHLTSHIKLYIIIYIYT